MRLRRQSIPATRTRVDHPGRGTAPGGGGTVRRRRRQPGAPSVTIGVHGGDAAESISRDERPLPRPRADPNLQKRRGRDATPPVSGLGPSTDHASIPSPRQQQPPKDVKNLLPDYGDVPSSEKEHPGGSGPAACGSARPHPRPDGRRLERRVRVPGCRVERDGQGVGHIARRARGRTASHQLDDHVRPDDPRVYPSTARLAASVPPSGVIPNCGPARGFEEDFWQRRAMTTRSRCGWRRARGCHRRRRAGLTSRLGTR